MMRRQADPNRPRSSRRRDQTTGFTIVELLVVVAIIGIIAGIIIPMLLSEIQRAQATAIVEEWRLLSEAVMLYEVDAGQALGGWVDKPKMPPELDIYISGDIVWENPGVGLKKSFVRMPVAMPGLEWQTVFLIRTDGPTRLIETVRQVHDGRQTAHVPGRTIGLIID